MASRPLRLIIGAALPIAVAGAIWFTMIRMPGKSFSGTPAPLSPEQIALREELRRDVQMLAGDIGERNFQRYAELSASAVFIEESLRSAGLTPRRDSYETGGRTFDNIEAEMPGTKPGIVVVGAHYDSVVGSPGANDNASGVAALLALARRFAANPTANAHTLRFVAFVNEEPPFFQTGQMGSQIYAGRCKARGDQILSMLSLETIGYFSDEAGSQTYPIGLLGAFYPKTANFVGIVGNVPSRSLTRRAIKLFRQHAQIPCEGAALPAFIPGIGWSDQLGFWQNGYRGIMITDTALFRYPHYHLRSDTPDKLDYDRFARVVSGIEHVIADFAGAK